jgi:nickel/cobalt transporter (NiCoT) family protein
MFLGASMLFRKLYYYLTITLVSVVVALLIGSVEAQGLAEDRLGLVGGFWDFIGALSYLIVGIFAVSWLASVAFYRFSGYDEIEERAADGLLRQVHQAGP